MGGDVPCIQRVQGMLLSLLTPLVETLANATIQFVEDEGGVIFYKNAYGEAAARPVFIDSTADDSGVEVEAE